jgi:hypothetical protein
LLLLVSGATKTVRRYSDSSYLGHLLTPSSGNRIESLLETGLPWAADNGAFAGFDEQRFLRMLDRIQGRAGCLFVAAPDVVADAESTLGLFDRWRRVIVARGLPLAFVAQDGQEALPVPWNRFDALFLGGSTGWKLSEHARALCRKVKARDKWVHMGRVNTRKRIQVAASWGCDSMDGSGFSRWPDTRIPKGLRWIEECTKEEAG